MIKLLFMGRKPVAAKLLRYIVKTGFYDVVGVVTDSHLEGSTTNTAAQELDIPVFTLEEVEEAVTNKTIYFDLALSILFWRRIKEPLLSFPKKGVINFHPAPLPDYKGTGGYNFAILDRLKEWEVTAHYVDETIDTGDIIKSKALPIDIERETAQSLERRSIRVLYQLVLDVLAMVRHTEERLETRPNIGGRYISREEMELHKKINEGDDVDTKVRAFWFPPYDGAYVEIDGKRFTLISEEILRELAPEGVTHLFKKSS
ncbi:MAG: hypothetical protein MK096_13580 [Oleiphilaceae bacterium]|nr:hypothetical protein [Oleiphilaceae bacterium]